MNNTNELARLASMEVMEFVSDVASISSIQPIIRAAIDDAVAQRTEECAKQADQRPCSCDWRDRQGGDHNWCCAKAIADDIHALNAPKKAPIILSNCCQFQCTVVEDDGESTRFYVCDYCGELCNPGKL